MLFPVSQMRNVGRKPRPFLRRAHGLDGMFGLECIRFAVTSHDQCDAHRRIAACVTGALAGKVGGIAFGHIGADAGVERAATAFQYIEKPVHA